MEGTSQLDHAASSELMRSHARLRVLADMSHAFATVATDYRALIEKIARTTADLVGDGCLVTLLDADGETLVNAASAHRDPALETDYRTYLSARGISKVTSKAVSAAVVRSGEPKLVADVSPDLVVAQSDDALKPVVARLNVHSFVVVPIRARGTIIGTLSLVRSGAGRSYTSDDLVLLLDLADRAGLAIDNARLYADLERRVRERTIELEAANQELEAFSYSVAHDLRAPARRIDGLSLALLEDHAEQLTAEGIKYLAHVRGAARQMSQLIDDLLDLSRAARAPVRRQSVDLSALALSVFGRLREVDPARTVELVVEPGLVAPADPRLVEVVLSNLLGNAWKFTSKRELARIEVGRTSDHPTVYFVRDNGVGFEPKFASRMFEAFWRMHPTQEFPGTGIGLATVQRIIRRHGGRVWADGEVDRGTTLYFTLEPASS